MDLRLMKNRIAVGAVILGLGVFFLFSILKFFPEINSKYNSIFLSTQLLVYMVVLSIILFVVFNYSWLTYIATFIAYSGLVNTYSRLINFPKTYLSSNMTKLLYYSIALILTFLTFYILKKCKVNMPKKEEGPEVIDMRRRKGGVPE